MQKLLVATGVLLFSGLAIADSHKDATDDVLELVQQIWEARNNNDYKTQRDLMSDGIHFNANSNGTFFYAQEKQSLAEIEEDLSGEYDVTVMYPNAAQLSETVVLARYYLEGSISADGNTVSNYRTRVSHIWVKEGGKWKSKSWHFSPLHNGGTIPN